MQINLSDFGLNNIFWKKQDTVASLTLLLHVRGFGPMKILPKLVGADNGGTPGRCFTTSVLSWFITRSFI
jgi:hypothetical protein